MVGITAPIPAATHAAAAAFGSAAAAAACCWRCAGGGGTALTAHLIDAARVVKVATGQQFNRRRRRVGICQANWAHFSISLELKSRGHTTGRSWATGGVPAAVAVAAGRLAGAQCGVQGARVAIRQHRQCVHNRLRRRLSEVVGGDDIDARCDSSAVASTIVDLVPGACACRLCMGEAPAGERTVAFKIQRQYVYACTSTVNTRWQCYCLGAAKPQRCVPTCVKTTHMPPPREPCPAMQPPVWQPSRQFRHAGTAY